MKEVAEAVGVSEGTVSRWECGQIENMRREKIYSLSQTLYLPIDTILGIQTDERIDSSEKVKLLKSITIKLTHLTEDELRAIDAIIRAWTEEKKKE